jgi:DNA-directed RNA polymerase specialized sigma24 family protein
MNSHIDGGQVDFISSEFVDMRKAARSSASSAGAENLWVDEIADEAMARLFLQDPPPNNPKGWVRRVARNLATDAFRAGPPNGWGDMPLSNPGEGQAHYPSHLRNPSPSARVRRRLQVDQVLAVLTPIEQQLLVGAAAGLSTKDLATEHGYTEGSVRTKISAAYRKLRTEFPDRADFDF